MLNMGTIKQEQLEALIPYARNARSHDDGQIAQIAASIREFGFNNPVLIDGNKNIIAGHGRVMAARKLGMTGVPCVVLDHMTPEQQRAYVIADNQIALNAGWDTELLALEISELGGLDVDLSLTGFTDLQLDGFKAIADRSQGLTDPDEVPEVPDDPVTKPGDLWVCGKHRVLCGDATSADDVARVLGDVVPHLMVTDPPYGIGYEYVRHDDSDKEQNAALVTMAFDLAPKSKVYTPGLTNLRRELNRFQTAKVAVWHKKFAAAGNGVGGANTWEPIIIESPMAASLKNDVLQIMTDRVEVDGVSLRKLHSCPKPVQLFTELLSAFSRPGDVVYDPFLGSGTTVIAAGMEGRQCLGIEITSQYVDVIVKRWQNFTGETAHLEDGTAFDD